MDAPRVKAVLPLAERRLLVTFVNGMQRVYDCTPLLGHDRFRLLKEEAFFKAVQVDAGGYGISWNDQCDLSEYELWVSGTPEEDAPAASPATGETHAPEAAWGMSGARGGANT